MTTNPRDVARSLTVIKRQPEVLRIHTEDGSTYGIRMEMLPEGSKVRELRGKKLALASRIVDHGKTIEWADYGEKRSVRNLRQRCIWWRPPAGVSLKVRVVHERFFVVAAYPMAHPPRTASEVKRWAQKDGKIIAAAGKNPKSVDGSASGRKFVQTMVWELPTKRRAENLAERIEGTRLRGLTVEVQTLPLGKGARS